ncbi:glycosyltransferase family 25 protein [Winogradskyella sp.]|nr:glycosyltransferase family 25 protein [Winogradskyella sp.]
MTLLKHIYVVTIKRNAERQPRIRKILNDHSLNFSFVCGVDGQDLKPKQVEKVFDAEASRKRLKYDLTKNEIACSLSHIKALKLFLENDQQEFALILEDDIDILNFESLPLALQHIPDEETWDLLYFGYQKMNMRMPKAIYIKWRFIYPILNFLKIKRYDLKKIRLIFAEPFNTYWFRAGSHNESHAYLVSRAAAEKIIAYNTPVTLHADTVLRDMITAGKLKAYALNKPIFEQSDSLVSSIGVRNTSI